MTDSTDLIERFKSNVLKSIHTPSPKPNTRKRPSTSYDSDISDSFIMESPQKKQRLSNYNEDIDDYSDDVDREFNELFDIVQNMHSENDTESETNVTSSIKVQSNIKPRRKRYFNTDNDNTEEIDDIQNKKEKNITFKCYNCDEVGHIARNCEYGAIQICFKCGDSGHSGFYCPNSICCLCLKPHQSHECNLFSPNKKALRFCIRCGSKQHYLNQCDAMLVHRLIGLQCFVCGKYGHLNCKASNNNNYKAKRVQLCSNCGDDDHTVYFCKHLKMNKAEIAIGLSTNPNDPKICFNCNEANHCSRNCPLIIRKKQQRKKNSNKFHYRSNTLSNQKNKKRKGNRKKKSPNKRLSVQSKWRKNTMQLIKAYDTNKKDIDFNKRDVK